MCVFVQALRLIKVREENSQRQAQLEERIIAPENDEFAVSKGKGSKVASVKRSRAASNRRFTSNLTPGDLDGRYRLEEEEGQEDLSAVCVACPAPLKLPLHLPRSAQSNCASQCEELP